MAGVRVTDGVFGVEQRSALGMVREWVREHKTVGAAAAAVLACLSLARSALLLYASLLVVCVSLVEVVRRVLLGQRLNREYRRRCRAENVAEVRQAKEKFPELADPAMPDGGENTPMGDRDASDVNVLLASAHAYLLFAYACFLLPVLQAFGVRARGAAVAPADAASTLSSVPSGAAAAAHQSRLQAFYAPQAAVYDVTRQKLLKGRSTMLRLCAAMLHAAAPTRFAAPRPIGWKRQPTTAGPSSSSAVPRVWLDVGSGTGSSVSCMAAYVDLKQFDLIVLLDLTPVLCQQARERCQREGWQNVKVICGDAGTFSLADVGLPADTPISLITCSYSLSMVQESAVFSLIDSLQRRLHPVEGVFGVVDFGCSAPRGVSVPGELPDAPQSALSRWFWERWFSVDGVHLHHARRHCLQKSCRTSLLYQAYNTVIGPIAMPWYVWIGRGRASNSPSSLVPLRQPYDASLESRYHTWLYGFSWEDTLADLKLLHLAPSDRMLILTASGCNALHYAAEVGPQRIYSVDVNPKQNHLAELKLALLRSGCDYEALWGFMGDGRLPKRFGSFHQFLDTHLAPHLSQQAYVFWRGYNTREFWLEGGSGLGIRFIFVLMDLCGITPALYRMLQAESTREQQRLWREECASAVAFGFPSWVARQKWFTWLCQGVPEPQLKLMINECGGDYSRMIADTMMPLGDEQGVRLDEHAFHWFTVITGWSRSPNFAPFFVRPANAAKLRTEPQRTAGRLSLHTCSVTQLLRGDAAAGGSLPADGELTVAVLMDHLDWMDAADILEELALLRRKLTPGARVLFRSAVKKPPHVALFEQLGFRLEQHVRPTYIRGQPAPPLLDRVNMYASSWVATLRSKAD